VRVSSSSGLILYRFPVPGHQLVEAGDGMIGNAMQNVGEPLITLLSVTKFTLAGRAGC
jgi:hypothetical protein